MCRARLPPSLVHREIPLREPQHHVFPIVHTPYVLRREVFHYMIETDVVVVSGMKLVCSRAELGAKLAVVARAVSTRTAVQILSGILLRAEGGELHLAATDMEVSLRASVGGEIAGDGAVVVPGRLLADLVRLLPDPSVALTFNEGDGVLEVISGSYASKVNVFSAEDFPRLPSLDVSLHTIDAPALLGTIDKVARAASRARCRRRRRGPGSPGSRARPHLHRQRSASARLARGPG